MKSVDKWYHIWYHNNIGGGNMASIDKVVDKMKRQPNGIRTEEVDKVLRHYNYRLDRQRGSHMQYINDTGDVLTIVARKPTIKKFYVDQILSRLNL